MNHSAAGDGTLFAFLGRVLVFLIESGTPLAECMALGGQGVEGKLKLNTLSCKPSGAGSAIMGKLNTFE